MSRYCGEVEPSTILKAASHWARSALVEGGSVLTGKSLWTNELLDALDRFYIQRLDVGEGNFLEKLKAQLAPAGPDAIQLAAEMMWLLYLCPRNIRASKKRQTLQTIWGWSGELFPADSPFVQDETLAGIGSGGPGFNQNQWRELVFCINLVRSFRKLDVAQQARLLESPWGFDEWLSGLEDADGRQFRHMLLFLLFPDDFERVFGQTDRRAIALQFSKRDKREIRRMSNLELDRELRAIRSGLESSYGRTDLDYYVPPLRDEWGGASLAEATAGLTPDHVREALRRIDDEGVPSSAQSVSYDLLHDGRRYPPKYVLSLAVEVASGEPLDRASFTGGAESACFRKLGELGFEIVAKKEDFREDLAKFVKQAMDGTELGTQGYVRQYRGLRVKVSFGQGVFARVPWIAFLGGEERVSKGIYPDLLFFREHKKLLLCYGVSETEPPVRSWRIDSAVETVARWFSSHMNGAPPRYGASFVAAAFDATSINLDEVQAQLDAVIDTYKRELEVQPSEEEPTAGEVPEDDGLPVKVDLGAATTSFAEALLDCGVSFGERHSTVVASFVASLTTKPLLILTGLSGSGKSQIALQFGHWLGGRQLVLPVRPDWTGPEALLGYQDALRPTENGLAAWHVPVSLEFMLRAHRDPQHPYLLVLDEMNLAHVERYFADLLSGMESGQPCLPNLSQRKDGCWRAVSDAAPLIPVPKNLWIVGTVNVDETTYMFSPKVLDRANTLEFRVGTADLTLSPKKPGVCAKGDADLVRGLQVICRDDGWHVTQPFSSQAALIERLHQLHRLLGRSNHEFGHRVFYEAVRFAAMAEKAGVVGIDAVLDLVVLQKILPRLHGSRRKLEGPLTSLASFCRVLPSEGGQEGSESAGASPNVTPRLQASTRKIERMMESLRTNQFVSFAE
ncbi:MAG: DUF3578 domain-containing protein [Burkholderiales bacterium]|nr:DUF3578 domain-containing protein [Burkholderiales bacterium]